MHRHIIAGIGIACALMLGISVPAQARKAHKPHATQQTSAWSHSRQSPAPLENANVIVLFTKDYRTGQTDLSITKYKDGQWSRCSLCGTISAYRHSGKKFYSTQSLVQWPSIEVVFAYNSYVDDVGNPITNVAPWNGKDALPASNRFTPPSDSGRLSSNGRLSMIYVGLYNPAFDEAPPKGGCTPDICP